MSYEDQLIREMTTDQGQDEGTYESNFPSLEQEAESPNESTQTDGAWQFITSAKAWSLARKSEKDPPYCGYLIDLKDGRRIRCRRDAHKTVFEVSQ